MARKQLIELLTSKPEKISFVYRIIGDVWRNADGSPVQGQPPIGYKTFTFQDLEDLEAVKQLLNNNLN